MNPSSASRYLARYSRAYIMLSHFERNRPTLRPRPEGSIDFDTTQNVIIEGDNLCEELFPEDGFVPTCIWQKRYSRENRGPLGDAHDYLVVVARNAEAFKASRGLLELTEEQARVYRNPNKDRKGGRIYFGKDGSAQPGVTRYLSEVEGGTANRPPARDVHHNRERNNRSGS